MTSKFPGTESLNNNLDFTMSSKSPSNHFKTMGIDKFKINVMMNKLKLNSEYYQ